MEKRNVKDFARDFAVMAHKGQIRKNEPEKPMIIHPFDVAQKLQDYGYDDNMIAAGYLHDVVEDTVYTIDNIREKFGEDISNLVYGASEPDKSLSWKERKQHTIEMTKTLSLRNKIVICADKVSNLEDLMISFQKSGVRDFSKFKKGEEYQKWYYSGVYESITYNEEKNTPIFKRLKELIDIVFNNKETIHLEENIFCGEDDYYNKLKILHGQKMELQKLKKIIPLSKPYVIEFSGTPRTGKSSMFANISDFFEKGGFRVEQIEEFMTSKYYKENLKESFMKMSSDDLMASIINEISIQLQGKLDSNADIILLDRGVNDRLIWNNLYYLQGKLTEKMYKQLEKKCNDISQSSVDYLVITYAVANEALKRDYTSSLALEKRGFLCLENIRNYNNSLLGISNLLINNVKSSKSIDTTNIDVRESTVLIVSDIMKAMRNVYIDELKKRCQ